jgi:hypothetical protein
MELDYDPASSVPVISLCGLADDCEQALATGRL